VTERRPNRVLGPGHDEFWAFCSNKELRLQRCDNCGHISWPAVVVCENCGQECLTWEKLSGRGSVMSRCTFEQPYYEELAIPWDTILVELEEGPLFISNPKGFTSLDLRSNVRVRVVFIDCEDAAGGFSLPVFEKAEP